MPHVSLAERVENQLGSGANLAYIQEILALDDECFMSWLSGRLDSLRCQTLAEFASHLRGTSEAGVCALGRNILCGDLRLLEFLVSERYAKFDAIDLSA